MKILVVGAGATGGYFGGRLLEAGGDVTFLVRPRRARMLAETGLVIRSPTGDFHHPRPPTVEATRLKEPADLVLLSCKAYDLEDAIRSFAPAVGAGTMILPLLNGMAHLEVLGQRFGAAAVLGGVCLVSATLGEHGEIVHVSEFARIAFGEQSGTRSPRAVALEATLAAGRFDSRLSDNILQEMWEKWVFIAAMAGSTCLMRATVGELVAAGGANFVAALVAECSAIATACGMAPSESSLRRARAQLTEPQSPLTSSMHRDLERGAPTEVEQVIGDLMRIGQARDVPTPLLRAAYVHLNAYERRRAPGSRSLH